MPRLFLILIFLTGTIFTVSGQNFFVTNTPVTSGANSLTLKFENTGFFKNNEFKSAFTNGYTLTGNWIRPKLVYLPSEKVEIELGWHYLLYNGSEKATWSIPWISARIRFLDNWQFILGDLDNSRNHRLISPIWEPERFLSDKPEAGFQFLHRSKQFYFDGWLNWEQFISDGDPFQEHLTAGISAEATLVRSQNIALTLPLQVLFHHMGGEIDSSPLRVQTLANTAIGLKTSLSLSYPFISGLEFAGYYSSFSDQKGNAGLPFEKGDGIFAIGSLSTKIGQFGLQYWNSENYYSIKGMGLLQSVPGIKIPYSASDYKKEMFQVFYEFEKELTKGFTLGTRLEGWFEQNPNNFSNTAAVYMVINQDFLLKKF